MARVVAIPAMRRFSGKVVMNNATKLRIVHSPAGKVRK